MIQIQKSCFLYFNSVILVSLQNISHGAETEKNITGKP